MKRKLLFIVYCISFFALNIYCEELKIGIMQDRHGVAQKYAPLIEYCSAHDLHIKLIGFKSYKDAAEKFTQGKIDAMFTGSGVAALLIMKGIAYPLLRPVTVEGWSTYHAVVIVPKAVKDFKLDRDYLKNKRIICCSLASSGEFFCRTLLGKNKKLLKAGNHGNAIGALAKKAADVAVVKNLVWYKVKDKYPELKSVAEDYGENPNNTLMFSSKTPESLAGKVKKILLGLKDDKSENGEKLKKSLSIKGYIPTTEADFQHTFELLKKAGITKDFKFNEK